MGISKKKWHDRRSRRIAKLSKKKKKHRQINNILGVPESARGEYNLSKHFKISLPKNNR